MQIAMEKNQKALNKTLILHLHKMFLRQLVIWRVY